MLAVGERRGLEEEYLEYLNRCLTESRNFRPKVQVLINNICVRVYTG